MKMRFVMTMAVPAIGIALFSAMDVMAEIKIVPPAAVAGDRVGDSVAISGDCMVVGASSDDEQGALAGAAYVYRYSGDAWVQETKLLASDGVANDRFGGSVSISGNRIVVGAYNKAIESGGQYSTGAAYIYEKEGGTWTQKARLWEPRANTKDKPWFGCSVCLDGDRLIVGAKGTCIGDWQNSRQIGAAYIYELDGSTWIKKIKILASDADIGDNMGWSVYMNGDMAVVGAPRRRRQRQRSGRGIRIQTY